MWFYCRSSRVVALELIEWGLVFTFTWDGCLYEDYKSINKDNFDNSKYEDLFPTFFGLVSQIKNEIN